MDELSGVHAVVLAGGSGTRFWPLSRRRRPKQLLPLGGPETLLQQTFARLAPQISADRLWLVVGQAHAEACRTAAAQVSEERVLVEPRARNTAPALALAAVHLMRAHPDAVMLALPADHHVADREAFGRAVARAATLAAQGSIATLGIQATYPATGYGYIARGERLAGETEAYALTRFCEKPDAQTAARLLARGGYDWNAGIFALQPAVYLHELRRQLPAVFDAMQRVGEAIGTAAYPEVLAAAYAHLESISIDHGIMEHARTPAAVVPVACGWSDLGTWDALQAVVPPDAAGNVRQGKVAVLDAHDCVLYATEGSTIAVAGVRGLTIVHVGEVVLVIPVEMAQNVRQVLDLVGELGWTDLL